MAGERDYYQVLGVPRDADASALAVPARPFNGRQTTRQRQHQEE
jgi:hypothetical protein